MAKKISIHPYRGYLNTEFQICSHEQALVEYIVYSKDNGKKAPKEYLNEALNVIKDTQDTSFKAIKSEKELMQNLEDNCIPISILDMDYTQYQSFLEGRRTKMTELIKQYYYSL